MTTEQLLNDLGALDRKWIVSVFRDGLVEAVANVLCEHDDDRDDAVADFALALEIEFDELPKRPRNVRPNFADLADSIVSRYEAHC